MGKSRLAPCPAHTIPPLELCAGVLAVERYELIRDEIDAEVEAVKFFLDSKIVLGYICNSTKRFYMYVSNRVIRIRRSTQPDQWHYVPTDLNPAELATRCVPTTQLRHGNWFSGAAFLYHKTGKTIKTIPSLIHVAASFRRSNNEGGDVLKRRWPQTNSYKQKLGSFGPSSKKLSKRNRDVLKEDSQCPNKAHWKGSVQSGTETVCSVLEFVYLKLTCQRRRNTRWSCRMLITFPQCCWDTFTNK